MRYVIIGAGAIGGVVGGRLAEAGHEVVLVARGTHLAALRERGLRLTTPEGTRTLRLPCAAGPEEVELRVDDVLVLAVKTQDSIAALDAWSGRPVKGGSGTAGEVLPLVCAQNGVENERLALRRFRHVYAMCVYLPATFVEPGAVSAAGEPVTGSLHLGRYPRGVDETARRISCDLEKSHFLAPAVPDAMRWKYGKLLNNLANSLDAVSGTEALATPAGRDLVARTVEEGRAALEAAGIAVASAAERAEAWSSRISMIELEGKAPGGGSSWQSLVRGTGSIEADYLNGEISLLGGLHGVPTPVNDLLGRLANEFARERRAAGSMPVEDVAALLAACEVAH
ncbi:2-dehydropantoate 2-reductase N-terminal domain-containing protein [Streptomyces sp. NPDC048442]|uniref:ketopantoate reductase family protein n=1 Tax=Streptomyces sp. NPDC048442 TaxID=3154823 RepID=UPI003441A928